MYLIKADGTNHLLQEDADHEIFDAYAELGMITDGCALTIASWYQTSGVVGSKFAQLATTGRVLSSDILHAIACERTGVRVSEQKNLDMLMVWVYDKVRRLVNENPYAR